MIYKRCPRCRKRIPEGTTCECQKKRHIEYNRYRRDIKSKVFYDSAEWKLTREGILLLDKYVDVYMYMVKHEIVEADTVHHIIPLREDWSLRCTSSNLISLAKDTHSRIEQEYKTDKEHMQAVLSKILTEYRKMVGV